MMRAGVCSSPCEACWTSSCSVSSEPSDSPPPGAWHERPAALAIAGRGQHRVELAVDLRGPRLLRMVVEGLQAVSGDDGDDGVIGREAARGGELLEPGGRRGAGRLGQGAPGGREAGGAG